MLQNYVEKKKKFTLNKRKLSQLEFIEKTTRNGITYFFLSCPDNWIFQLGFFCSHWIFLVHQFMSFCFTKTLHFNQTLSLLLAFLASILRKQVKEKKMLIKIYFEVAASVLCWNSTGQQILKTRQYHYERASGKLTKKSYLLERIWQQHRFQHEKVLNCQNSSIVMSWLFQSELALPATPILRLQSPSAVLRARLTVIASVPLGNFQSTREQQKKKENRIETMVRWIIHDKVF